MLPTTVSELENKCCEQTNSVTYIIKINKVSYGIAAYNAVQLCIGLPRTNVSEPFRFYCFYTLYIIMNHAINLISGFSVGILMIESKY